MGWQVITVLMGAPGAGKSTWVEANKSHGIHIYNTEAVRTNRGIDIGEFMRYERIKAIKAAELGVELICDGTHTIPGHRAIWLTVAQQLNIKTRLIAFDTSLLTLLQVQRERQHPAPDKVVIDHYRRFQLQKHVVNREPWGSIELITRGQDA
jgi:predicted kinase